MARRTRNLILMILIDAIFTVGSYYISYLSCMHSLNINHWKPAIIEIIFTLVLFEILMFALRLRQVAWQYAGFDDVIKIGVAAFCACMVDYLMLHYICNDIIISSNLYKSFYAVFAMLLFISTLFVRIIVKEYADHRGKQNSNHSEANDRYNFGKVMIIGCGDAAMLCINSLLNNPVYSGTKVCCIIDDDPEKYHMIYQGIMVVGDRKQIVPTVLKQKIDTIIFSIPSCPSDSKREILDLCAQTTCQLKTVPSLSKLLCGEEEETAIKDIEIEDLLERDVIHFELDDNNNYLKDRMVMVTGGGGSIGSELCRQIAKRQPKALIIFDIYENNAYDIQNELRRKYPDLDIVTLIGSVRDEGRLDAIFATYHPQIVFHAAAHKHVPLMEDSPHESIKNNVFGTYQTCKMCDKYGVTRFVLISTDKAVNPTNIMGASKRLCEMVVQYFSRHSKTEFVAVRFGNVLGSNGSVIPLFKKQIEAGGPVTVTDPEIIRYFMTIPEAVSLVLQAGARAHGGEIFVLDMGEPVKILKLAENMIRLSGYIPYKTMKIEFTGLRPGEKLFEELLMDEEGLRETENKLIYIGSPVIFDDDVFLEQLKALKRKAYDETSDIKKAVSMMVKTYHYN